MYARKRSNVGAEGIRVSQTAIIGLVAACLLALAGHAAAAAAATALPDGRAWEMVSPLSKNGGDVVGIGADNGGGVVKASADGSEITYVAEGSFVEPEPLGALANQYVSQRGPGGWSVQNMTTPANAGTYGVGGTGAPYKAFSSDLSLGLLLNGEGTGEAAIDNPPLPSEPKAPPGYQTFYLRAGIDGRLTALLTVAPAVPANEFYMYLQGASSDLRHVVVWSDAALTAGATVEGSAPNIYEWTGGAWQAVNVLPTASGGATVPGAQLGSGLGESNTVSDNGSHVFWSYGANTAAALYVRNGGTETVRIDAPNGGPGVGVNENPFPQFQAASTDGLHAFFTSHAPLTSDANTGPPCGLFCKPAGNDLYEFDVQTGGLRDLSPDHQPADEAAGANVQGVVGVSGDGSHVYFIARGILGSGINSEGHSPVDNADNLYVWSENPATHTGTTSFIATLSPDDEGSVAHDWSPEVIKRTSRVTPDGRHAVFMSDASLTGYDNVDAMTKNLDEEVYLYDAEAGRLRCASCNPSGMRPLGPSAIPGGTPFEHRPNGGALYQSRAVSEDGSRVFFDSNDALVPQDTNGRQDVYEYEAGHAYLISGGTSSDTSEFVDASSSGNDVFFLTRQQLVGSDTDQLVDLYDARVGGGVSEQVPSSPCVSEDCKPQLSPPPVLGTSSASETFAGVGNLAPVVSKPATKPKRKKRHRTIGKKKHRTRARGTGRKTGRSHGARRVGKARGGG